MWNRVYENVHKMLQRRGFQDHDIRNATAFPDGAKEVVYLKPAKYAGKETKCIFIDTIGNAECREVVRDMRQEKITHLIIVANNIPGRFNQDMDQISAQQQRYGLRFELFDAGFFEFDRLSFDIMQQCRPVPMSLQESQKWLQDNHLQPSQMLQYIARDFVVRYFGLVSGQIVTVYCGGNTIKHRIFYQS